MDPVTQIPGPRLIDTEGLDDLYRALVASGYHVIGPAMADGAITLRELSSAAELPFGWGVRLEPGGYRVRRRDDTAAFGHSAGPQSWKRFLHPPRERLWSATRTAGGFELSGNGTDDDEAPRYAFLGVRPCDLRAIAIQDRILARPASGYAARRDRLFIIAVNCTEPGETCFCTSMGTGPGVREPGSASFRGDDPPGTPRPASFRGDDPPGTPRPAGSGGDEPRYDLALTELVDDLGHRFLVEVGSEQGVDILWQVRSTRADDATVQRARSAVGEAAGQMGRQMESRGLRELMADSHQAARWDDVAARCLSCGNCTMACPTCFCTTIVDTSDLTGEHAERWEQWDSCFDLDFSYLAGGSVRSSPKSRYRQWLTHKLGTWHDQFGSSGCVGCGRCIVWCPTGIDLTEEVKALRTERAQRSGPGKVMTSTQERAVTAAMPTGPMRPARYVVAAHGTETGDTVTLTLRPADNPIEPPRPGQFTMLYAFGVGEVPISVSGLGRGHELVQTIRAIGAVTRALCAAAPGDMIGVRGPFGTRWRLDVAEGRDLLVVAGGIGLAPLRPVLLTALEQRARYGRIILLVGARSPSDLLFTGELETWRKRGVEVRVTVDRASAEWKGNVGLVTRFIDGAVVDPAATTAFVCGPEIMMRVCAHALVNLGVAAEDIQVSLERNMRCGDALCGHCQLGPLLLCRDGPVVSYAEAAPLAAKKEL